MIASKGKETTNWKIQQILFYCCCAIIAGVMGRLHGLGGGFILGPLFLELGIPPQLCIYYCQACDGRKWSPEDIDRYNILCLQKASYRVQWSNVCFLSALKSIDKTKRFLLWKAEYRLSL